MRCDARFGGSAAYPRRRIAESPKSEKTGESPNRRIAESPKSEKTGEKRENRRIAESPKSEKTGEKRENRRKARKQAKSEKTGEKRENRRKARKQAKRSGRLENVLNVRYCGVPRGTSISCSTWNVYKLLSFNNLCKNVLNVHIIRSTYSDYKLLITSNLTF